jgi:3-polyprenyl-4-hydroxybenzoate decarboxylase
MSAAGSKLGIDATKKLPGEGFKRPWPPLFKMDARCVAEDQFPARKRR